MWLMMMFAAGPTLRLLLGADTGPTSCGTNSGFLPNLYDNGLCKSGEVSISSVQDAFKLVGNLIRILIAVSGMLAVLFIIIAAIYYIVSMGDPGRVKQAKDILTNLVIGLVIIIASYAIVSFISAGF
jgi:hypothetical protein